MVSRISRSHIIWCCAAVLLLALITSSCGPKEVKVPDLVGKNLDDACGILTKENLTLGSVSEAYHETAPEGTVISQSVGAGERVQTETAVSVTVSKGPQPEMTTVPSVTGMTSVDAYGSLSSANLLPFAYEVASTQPEGTIVLQYPDSGSSVPVGSRVELAISRGPDAPYTYILKYRFKVNSTYKGPVTVVVTVEDDRGSTVAYRNDQHYNEDLIKGESTVHGSCRGVVFDVRGPKGHWSYASDSELF